MDFEEFKKIIADYAERKIDRNKFCELWLAEQKRQGFAL